MNIPTPTGLSIDGLESVYDQLAEAIDVCGERHPLMLTKLALLMAQQIGDAKQVADLITRAQCDL